MGVKVIAEAGVNHNGNIDLAKKMINAASEANADFIKFQTFKSEKLASKEARKADYQMNHTENEPDSQLKMLQKLELNHADHKALIDYCKTKNIRFLSSAFDMDSLEFLHSLSLGLWKIPSGEITNRPFLERIGSFGQEVVLSTGMSYMEEIGQALEILIKSGTKKENIIVLHCNTEYPTPYSDVNLKAMLAIKKEFDIRVGYSDHTLGIETPIAAVALGAEIIEKHFTLDKNMNGPDHKASLEPAELKEMVRCIRNTEQAMGSGRKSPSASELKNKILVRKSIFLARNIPAGSIISLDDLTMKRPGDGISPMIIQEVLNRKSIKKLKKDHKLKWEDLE